MKLRVLGSGTSELRRERSSPAYLVEAGGKYFLLDLGQGALRRLMQAGVEPSSLSAVLISHHHLDHMSDLFALLFALRYDPVMKENARLSLVAHRAFFSALDEVAAVFGDWLRPPGQALTRIPLEPGEEADLDGVRVLTAPAAHIATSLAFRLEAGGQSLVYLGDSEYSPELARLARGADLLLSDCAGTDESPKPGHLYPAACGRLAAEAGVKTLLLSHFHRAVDPQAAISSAQNWFSGRVLAARDHLEIVVGG